MQRSMARGNRRNWRAGASTIALGLLLPLGALAQPTATTVPWVPANPNVPHDIRAAINTTLKGAEMGPDYTGTRYKWDFGDGESTGFQAIGNPRVLAATHSYQGAVGSPFTATLTVCDAADDCTTADYPMVIRPDSQATNVNIAIDQGLWYLYQQALPTGQIRAAGSYGEREGSHAGAVNAFEAHGHLASQDPAANPYATVVAAGLDYLFTIVSVTAIANTPSGNPDSNGNGIYVSSGSGQDVYETGMLMDAIIASGTPDRVVTTGPLAARDGYTYADAIQDMVDAYAFGQMNSSLGDHQKGSWYYNFTRPGHADNSSSGWAAIGLIPAERHWDATVPAFVKDLNFRYALPHTRNANGVFGYSATNCIWGCAATTANGMAQTLMSWDTAANVDRAQNAREHANYANGARWLADN